LDSFVTVSVLVYRQSNRCRWTNGCLCKYGLFQHPKQDKLQGQKRAFAWTLETPAVCRHCCVGCKHAIAKSVLQTGLQACLSYYSAVIWLTWSMFPLLKGNVDIS